MSPLVEFPTPEWSSETAKVAFDKAIEAGRLSADVKAPNYAGDVMYMGSKAGKDLFKHRDTRAYLP